MRGLFFLAGSLWVVAQLVGSWRQQLDGAYKAHRRGAMSRRREAAIAAELEAQGGVPLLWLVPATSPPPTPDVVLLIEVEVLF